MTAERAGELIISAINEKIATRGRAFVGIDGRLASGKTTLTAHLKECLLAEGHTELAVVHADDFFLRPHQRTADRLATPGGNLDRERLLSEVLTPLSAGRTAVYRPYLCSSGAFGEEIAVSPVKILIVEGSYSCHPELAEYYDIRVFLDTPPDLQWERVLKREGCERAAAFRDRWIPLEEKYFCALDPASNANIRLHLDGV